MSKYTTEVRFLCETFAGKSESEGYNSVNEIIASARPVIFDFSYPIFDNNYKGVLETKILKHFYTREIGEETYGLWKLRLNTRMNEIMPFFNKLYESELLEFNPLYSTSKKISHSGNRNDSGNRTENTTGSSTTNDSGTNSVNTLNLYSDTPQGGITNLKQNGYLTNATDNTSTETNTNTTSINGTNSLSATNALTSTDSYIDIIEGYEGQNPSRLVVDFRNSIINIDVMILENLEDLFMQLW